MLFSLDIQIILICPSKFNAKCISMFSVLRVDKPSQLAVVWPGGPVVRLNIWVVLDCWWPHSLAREEGGREGGESVWWVLSPVWALSYFTTLLSAPAEAHKYEIFYHKVRSWAVKWSDDNYNNCLLQPGHYTYTLHYTTLVNNSQTLYLISLPHNKQTWNSCVCQSGRVL